MEEVRVIYWIPEKVEVSEDIPKNWLQDAIDIIVGDYGEVLRIEKIEF